MHRKPPTEDIDYLKIIQSGTARIRTRTEKLRVAIGVFDDSASLAATILELLSYEFNAAELCVIGTGDTLTLVASVEQKKRNIDSRLNDLLTHLEPYDPAPRSLSVKGSRGTLFRQLNELSPSHQIGEPHEACSRFSSITAELQIQVDQGRLLLIVNTEKPRHLFHAFRALLRHSTHDVQAHEFRPKYRV